MSGVMKTCVIKFIRKGTGISRTETEYAQNQSSTTAPTSGWNVNPPTWQNGYYIWQRIKFIYTDNSYSYSNAVCISGGNGISSVAEHYLATSASSGVTKNTSGWTTTVQAVTSTKKYLWNYETTTYTDGSTVDTTPVIIGVYGEKGDTGVSISSVTEYYLATSSSSGVTRNTSGWTISIHTITSTKKYLWNYEKITYTDNSTSYTDPVIIGVYGDKGEKGDTGTGISSVTEYYLATSSSSGVTRNTSGWTTSVQSVTATKKYLWNYEKITYADNTTSYTDPVIIGVYGDKGVGISSVTEYYLATSASSGVTTSTSGWTTSVQSVTATKKYLWNYEKITYTDNSTQTTTPVIIGVYGDKGDKGDQGKQGPTLRVQDWNKCTSNGTVNYTFYQGDVENLDEPYKDVVLYNNNYYSCIKTHSDKSIKPTNQTYWQLGDKVELVATNVLLATYSLIKNLGAEAIEMKDGNGNILFSAKNGVVTCNTGIFNSVTIKGNLYTPYYNIDTSNIASLATYTYDSTYGFYYYALDLAKTGLNIQINPGTSAPVYISLPANSTYKGAEANILCTNYYVVLRGVYRMNGSGVSASYVAYNPMLYKGQKIKLKCIYDGGYKWVIDSKSDYIVPESPALIGFGETSLGYYSSGWSVSLVKNFNTCGTGAFTVSRIEDSKYRVYRPSSWSISLTDVNLLISVYGKGYVFDGTSRTSASPCKATLVNVQSNYFDVVTSDDDSKNDGEFGFTIHYAGRINSYVV